jgi:hypothetical protein
MNKKLKDIYSYLGLTGTIVCFVGASIMIAPIVIVIINNLEWSEVVSYKRKIAKSGIEISYDFCEGNKEYILRKSKDGATKGVVICTQKSRTKIGKPDYIMSVLYKATGIKS